MVRLTDRPAMTIAVDLERKATKQTNKKWATCDNVTIMVYVLKFRTLSFFCS